ncbi:response regulator [Plebeiibacterium sediminum]|uniref:Response regulator transcription factor n=1 Tax=Plebeiibacterium sediminum TaxID=2992112 RepID=A0AAE3M755_9BACT|nr:response regulator transcription factor [Plebeiobacterium sediminum]MCW3787810.1 response regulator transcription factor [Plebeiobacterium sediminum]
MINIAIVDDHEMFREGLVLVLSQVDEINVVGNFNSGDSFLKALEELDIDIVLMDIKMEGLNGIETTQRAKSVKPDLKVIAVTMFVEDSYYMQMINAGAHGFVLKKAGKYELVQAIHEVNNGGNYFSQEILQKMAFKAISGKDEKENQLSTREVEVLQLICKGLSTKEISEALFISQKTVEVHRSNILRKSDQKNIAQLVIWAIKNNYTTI